MNFKHCGIRISRHSHCSQLCRDEVYIAVSSSAQSAFDCSNMWIFSITLPLNQVSVLVSIQDLCLEQDQELKELDSSAVMI